MSHDFNFAKFRRQHREEELASKDEIIGLASIDVPPNDPLEQYLLDHENDMSHEFNFAKFRRQPRDPILKEGK